MVIDMLIESLIPEIQNQLMGPEFSMKHQGSHLRSGVCPECGRKTLWTWYEKPLRLQCDHESSCGARYTVKQLLPYLFERINDRYPPTPEDPFKTAKAYLSLVRGFDVEKMAGWFGQGVFWKAGSNQGTATVRFYLNADKTIWFDRFVDDVVITEDSGKQKTRNKDFVGAYGGLWWQPPTLEIEYKSEVIFTEGVLDAVALNLNGFAAVSIMSAGTFPYESIKPYLKRGITWVLGLDTDKAGLANIKKHAKTLRDLGETVRAAVGGLDGEKCDWNELHQQGKLSDGDMQKYRLYGDILLAESKEQRAVATFLLHDEKVKHFVFDYKRSTYSVLVDIDKYTDEDVCSIGSPEAFIKSKTQAFKLAAKITRIAEFSLDYLYHQKPENGNDGQYVFRVSFANFAPSKELLLPHNAFSSATKFRECALTVSGVMFDGNTKDVSFLYKKWTARWRKVVKTLHYIGYDTSINAYVFNNIAVKNGQVHKLNSEGYFSFENGGIKTLVENGQAISLKEPIDFYLDYQLAFGMVGLVALTWSLGSLFAEQIALKHGSYPFFELTGREGGTGKSHLVEFLYKLQGREYTPFNPFNSTPSARMCEPSVVSNSIFCCNEGQSEDDSHRIHSAKFAWTQWKDFYERKGVRTINTKTQSTITPPFRGALMIVQNVTVAADTPFLQRICYQMMTSAHHSLDGRHADMRLKECDKSALSGWLVKVLKQEAPLLKRFFERYEFHNSRLQKREALKTQRIMHNHSQLMALADCLHLVVPISNDKQQELVAHIEQMAVDREVALQRDHPIIEQFWQTFEDINGLTKNWKTGNFEICEGTLNHSSEPGTIAINLTHFYQEVISRKIQFTVDVKELKRVLVTSTRPRFVDSNVCMYSAINNKPVRCWIFKNK